MGKCPNLIGERFDRLMVVGRVPNNIRGEWYCVCDCGNQCRKTTGQLRSGRKTAMCLECRRTFGWRASHKHGFGYENHLYRVWVGIKQRCSNPKGPNWRWYGAKGVKRCPEWDDFVAFRDWAFANGYAPDLTVDRINSDADYEPSNCRWITPAENTRRALAKRWHGVDA